jgi:hypothetical protein
MMQETEGTIHSMTVMNFVKELNYTRSKLGRNIEIRNDSWMCGVEKRTRKLTCSLLTRTSFIPLRPVALYVFPCAYIYLATRATLPSIRSRLQAHKLSCQPQNLVKGKQDHIG